MLLSSLVPTHGEVAPGFHIDVKDLKEGTRVGVSTREYLSKLNISGQAFEGKLPNGKIVIIVSRAYYSKSACDIFFIIIIMNVTLREEARERHLFRGFQISLLNEENITLRHEGLEDVRHLRCTTGGLRGGTVVGETIHVSRNNPRGREMRSSVRPQGARGGRAR